MDIQQRIVLKCITLNKKKTVKDYAMCFSLHKIQKWQKLISDKGSKNDMVETGKHRLQRAPK